MEGPRATALVAAGERLAAAADDVLEDAFREVRDAFDALRRSQEIPDELHRYMDIYRQGRVPKIEEGKQGEIVLFNNQRVFISIATYEQAAQTLHTHPVRGLFAFLDGEPFRVRRYRLPRPWDSGRFDRAARLSNPVERLVRPGDLVQIDGKSELLWFGYRGLVTVLKFMALTDEVQNWAFDMKTLSPIDAESVNVEFDSLIHTAHLLKAIDSPTSVQGLRTLSMHKAHFVRWEAIRALGSVDPQAGLDALRKAADDPHPEIRHAAHAALDRFLAR